MKLEWLEVLEFRHVTPGARMEFADGVNVIMGRNGTGKTNLLKLLGALTRWDVSALEKERFHVKYGAKAGELRLEVELKNVPPRPRFRMDDSEKIADVTDGDWLVKVVARAPTMNDLGQEFTPRRGDYWWGEQKLPPILPQPGIAQALIAASMTLVFPESSVLRVNLPDGFQNQAFMRQIFSHRGRGRIDEGLEQFIRMNDGGSSDGFCPGGVVIRWISYSDGRLLTSPGELSSSLRTWLESANGDEDVLEADLAEVAPELVYAAQILGLSKLRFLIRRTERRVESEFTTDTMKGITFKAILPNGSEFDQDKLSFGQKRMLTFLWYAAANEHGPIIVDELANGLHHAWIQKCFEVIGDRQAFLSTQNPLILDFLDFTSAEHTARSMVRCEVGERGWRWGNLNTEEAERLYRACQANFMHVSEILRSEGLW